jgi:DinB family protein
MSTILPGGGRVRRLHRRALDQAETLLALAAGEDEALARPAEKVSRWSTAEHLAHLVLVDRSVLARLDRALAPDQLDDSAIGRARSGAPHLTLLGRLVLGTGYIPRGSGRTPDPYRPEAVSLAALRGDLGEVRDRIGGLGERLGELAASERRFRHFLFGELTGMQWLRFMGVHHHHHLKIIRDIGRAQRRAPAAGHGRRAMGGGRRRGA